MTSAATRRDVLTATGIAVLVVLTRLPFVGRILYNWDSVNYAQALRRFDVAHAMPQFPGYILYVGLARLVHAVVPDPQTALTGISVVSSGLAAAALYALGRMMGGRSRGVLSAALLATSPLFWFYSDIAVPHILDCVFIIVAVALAYQLRLGRAALAIPAAIWLGLAGGLRPQTQMFLMPVMAYGAWRLGWRRAIAALAVLVLVDLAWFVPLVQLSGGLRKYLTIQREYSHYFISSSSVLEGAGLHGLANNSWKLTKYTLFAWGLALLPALFAFGVLLRSGRLARAWRDERVRVWTLWLLPAVLFYALVHMGQSGMTLVFLPALMLPSAVGLEFAIRSRPALGRGLAGALLAANAASFVIAPERPLGDRLKLLTADTLRAHDARYVTCFEAIRTRFPSAHTVVVSTAWCYPQYYLPEYRLIPYRLALTEAGGTRAVDPDSLGVPPDTTGVVYAVFLDEAWHPGRPEVPPREVLRLPRGQDLVYARIEAPAGQTPSPPGP